MRYGLLNLDLAINVEVVVDVGDDFYWLTLHLLHCVGDQECDVFGQHEVLVRWDTKPAIASRVMLRRRTASQFVGILASGIAVLLLN